MSKQPLDLALRRLVVRSPNWLGDAVMAMPALEQLARKLPRAEIGVLAREEIADLYLGHPRVSEILRFNRKDSVLAVSAKIKAGKFDAALVFPNSHRTAIEVFLARVPLRAGLITPFRSLFLTHTTPARPERARMRKRSISEARRLIDSPVLPKAQNGARAHHVYDYLHLVSELFGADPEPVPPALYMREDEVRGVLEKFGLQQGQRFLALAPGAQYGPAKCWPAENFVGTALGISKDTRGTWLVLGGNRDAPDCEKIARALNEKKPGVALSLAGKTSLRELMALLKRSSLLLTNDSGPMHLASALGTATVAFFGSTSPELTGPFPPDSRHVRVLRGEAACSPCYLRECPTDLRCLKSISVQAATKAALDVLPKD